jgi:hypothetical protein
MCPSELQTYLLSVDLSKGKLQRQSEKELR